MKTYPNLTGLWRSITQLVSNSLAAKKELARVPRIKRASYFAPKLKKRKARLARLNKLEAELGKLRAEEHREAWEVSRHYDTTKERCDGYVSERAMKRLFGKRR